ncbi:DUF2535 family protein [Cytobacillus suaedae]|nr:DUF2535 family protein [Cytobacillus suaedae]
MLFKSLEFKHCNGQKVKVMDIPVLEEGNTYHFMLSIRLERLIRQIHAEKNPNKVYSFKHYLKKVLKWRDYEQLFETGVLKNNA